MLDSKIQAKPLIDKFGRQITYLRLSVTDRCDLRCTYCMAERMKFLPKTEILSLEELEELADHFIQRGVKKIRITGGEPLVRPGIIGLVKNIGSHLGKGLNELTLTTNGTQLDKHAQALYDAGVRRLNVSLDTLEADKFQSIARRNNLHDVLRGIEAALSAGLKIKINTVALKNSNLDEIPTLIEWAHSKDMDLTLIEVMPLGETGEDRFDQYIPLPDVRSLLEQKWTLQEDPSPIINGGPSRYVQVKETGGRLGFITPLTNNFCAGCNRVRITCTGRIYMCLGQEDHVDLRAVLRNGGDIHGALDYAMGIKPEKHEFDIGPDHIVSGTSRHMSTTGG